MYKKDLKLYVTPEMETFEVEMESTLLDVSIGGDEGETPLPAPGLNED